jgi:hypothetical protein
MGGQAAVTVAAASQLTSPPLTSPRLTGPPPDQPGPARLPRGGQERRDEPFGGEPGAECAGADF